jgi:hypothetical protein
MNKLTLSAIIASTLFITACDQAQETTEGAMDKATEMTHSAAEHAENAAEAGKDMAAGLVDQAKEKMDGFMGSGFHDAATGHPVGTQSDIDALTAQYHEQMKAH